MDESTCSGRVQSSRSISSTRIEVFEYYGWKLAIVHGELHPLDPHSKTQPCIIWAPSPYLECIYIYATIPPPLLMPAFNMLVYGYRCKLSFTCMVHENRHKTNEVSALSTYCTPFYYIVYIGFKRLCDNKTLR